MNIIKKSYLAMVLVGWLLAGALEVENGWAGTSPDDRPNVVLIMTDDQGIGDLGVMGNPVIENFCDCDL